MYIAFHIVGRNMFKVFEAFSGIGSQAKALSNITSDYEIINTADWDINAIIAYYLIHKDYSTYKKYDGISDEDINKHLQKYALSSDGKTEMKGNAYNKLPASVKRLLYVAIAETHNMVNIADIKGIDMPSDVDLFTYSFPCQDLSLCGCWHGNKSGISRTAHNRSGMLWEVERILLEMNDGGIKLPKFLLMENVTNILSKPHARDFNDWKSTLTDLGYYNIIYRLNARNFGIPQNRERAYMLSILCNDNEFNVEDLDNYFIKNNLQVRSENGSLGIDNLKLKDILRLDYSNQQYRSEADTNNPNNTPSRQQIWDSNDVLVDRDGRINNIIVNTVTTKQDRNPNSGVIFYEPQNELKSKFRYLTPRECFMLMGFKEIDYQRIVDHNIITNNNRRLFSNEKLSKMAGNSIVVNVLEEIFKQILELSKNNKIG